MNLLRRLWTEEPVIVRTGLALAVSAGLLTATQASTWADAVSAVLVAVGAVSARGKVTPASTPAKDAGHSTVDTLLLLATFVMVLLLVIWRVR